MKKKNCGVKTTCYCFAGRYVQGYVLIRSELGSSESRLVAWKRVLAKTFSESAAYFEFTFIFPFRAIYTNTL